MAPTNPNTNANDIDYTTGGWAKTVIDRPPQAVFDTLTDVPNWPNINKGVTISVTPKDAKVEVGAQFTETIQAPVEGMGRWSNTWTVQELVQGKKFVMTAMDNFSSIPIPSRLTYTFTAVEGSNGSKTTFFRSIDTAPTQEFWDKAKPEEKEALYRFQGSQSEMAAHLKQYVEQNTPAS